MERKIKKYPVRKELFVSKKTGKKYLMHPTEVRIDIENEVERDLKEYKPKGGNNIFDIYEKITWQ